jgi:hypothetical protein
MKIKLNPTPKTPNEANGLNVQYASAKRVISKWRWRLILLLMTSPLLIFGFKILYEKIWAVMPGQILINQIVLVAPRDSRVSYIAPVDVPIPKGGIIASFSDDVLSSTYNALKGEMENTSTHRKPAFATVDASVIEGYEKLHEMELKRYKEISFLVTQGAATATDEAKALASVTSVQIDLANALKGSIAKPQEQLFDDNSIRLAQLIAQMKSLTLYAPSAGHISEYFVRPRENVLYGKEVAVFQFASDPFIKVYLDPSWSKYAVVGNKATISLPNGPLIRATVNKVKMFTEKVPSTISNPLIDKPSSIVVELKTEKPLPKRFQINQLGVMVRFDLF